MSNTKQLSLAGQTMQWKFEDGPTAGATYEHTFNDDGTVAYKQVGAKAGAAKPDAAKADAAKRGDAKPSAEEEPTKYASFEVAEGVHLVSYKSGMGWTLTICANIVDETLKGFASNDKEWYPVTGSIVG